MFARGTLFRLFLPRRKCNYTTPTNVLVLLADANLIFDCYNITYSNNVKSGNYYLYVYLYITKKFHLAMRNVVFVNVKSNRENEFAILHILAYLC